MAGAGEAGLWQAVTETRADLDAMLRLIEDMLGLASAEATGSAGFVPIALDAIVGEVLDLYEPLAVEKGLTLTADLLPMVLPGSRTPIARMVSNLLDNAVKFTPRGGAIGVVLDREGDVGRLIVSDSGPGIPSDHRQQVLGRFRRLDESRSTPGNGLGLSIVEAVVRIHRGRLALADNAPGLRVEIGFPLDRMTVANRWSGGHELAVRDDTGMGFDRLRQARHNDCYRRAEGGKG
jgi:signal transduction histidine kinase